MRDYQLHEFNGTAYNLHTNSLEDSAVIGLKGKLEPKLQYLFARFVRPGDITLDIGANSGFHTVCLSKIVGEEGLVHAFEPVVFNYNKMVTNLHLNGSQNVVTHPYALGNVNEKQMMNVIREGEFEQGNHSLAANEKIEGILKDKVVKTEVQVSRLDDVLGDLEALDFIKIDVEGFEIEVIKGASILLKKFCPIIIMEWVEGRMRHIGVDPAEFLPLLGDDYIFFEINCDDESDKGKVTSLSPYTFGTPMSAGSWDLVCLPKRRFEPGQHPRSVS